MFDTLDVSTPQGPTTRGQVRVIYIAGTGRSGSTILGNVLGQLEGFFHAGELWHVWDEGLMANRLCGCGERFRDCRFWGQVVTAAFGAAGEPDIAEAVRWRDRSTRLRHLPLRFFTRAGLAPETPGGRFLQLAQRLYYAIREATGGSVIIDSSKGPSYAYALSLIPGLELTLVQLVRDPRAVAYSSRRKKLQPDLGVMLPTAGPMKTSAVWLASNAATRMVARSRGLPFLCLRYEDFVGDPPRWVAAVARAAGAATPNLTFLGTGYAKIGPRHTVSGNPARHDTGLVPLRVDDEWRSNMKLWERALVTALTWPVLRACGY